MKLTDLLSGINYTVAVGNDNMEVKKLEHDSREVKKGDVFFCIEGYATDGHKYAAAAIKNGASVIVAQKKVDDIEGCTVIMVEDTRKALALAASNYYDHPEKKLKMIGITGTKGKTTSTYIMKSILENAGYKVGIIGTIANYIGDKKIPSHRTTPESLELQGLLKDMVDAGMDYCVMEVSSHSLYLNRVYGIEYSEAVFTNLTQDHLDFHKTFENYYNAKLILFKNTKNSIINIDNEYGKRLFKDAEGNKITYGIEKEADIEAKDINMHSRGVEFNILYKGQKKEVSLNLPGMYNVENAIGSAAACLNEGISLDVVVKGLNKMEFVPGRCETVGKKYNLDFEIIIDYAHSPDSLENILKCVKEFTKGRLISVFGCGGDRDKTKRPIMGRIGSDLSDFAVITSDNPRSEEPMSIINDVVSGIEKENYFVIENRKDAIKEAIKMAKKDDVIVIAGKGHEDYQILKDKTIHFDEREVIAEIIDELNL